MMRGRPSRPAALADRVDETARPSPLVGGEGFVFVGRLGEVHGWCQTGTNWCGDAVSTDSPAEDG